MSFKNCFAVRKGNTLLLSRFIEGLHIIGQTGEYSELYEKWLGVLEPTGIFLRLVIKYAVIVLTILLLLMAGILLWNRMLRIRVNKKTKELRESEQKFRKTVMDLDEGYYSATLDGVLLEHNQAFARILGFDEAADLKGTRLPDFWQNPDDRNVCLKELAANDFISGYQVEARTKTGEKITVIISAHLVKDTDNLPQRIEGVVLDITYRKQAEEEIKKSERFLESVFSSIQDGISVLGPDLSIRRVNEVMNKWYSENVPLEGKKCYEAYHKKDKPCDPCPTLRCLKTGKTEREVVHGPSSSDIKWIELFSYPIKDFQTGEITGVVEFVRNITERKKTEEEVIHLNTHLEQKIAERTAELTAKTAELERINKVFVDRELRMRELKKRIEELEKISEARKNK